MKHVAGYCRGVDLYQMQKVGYVKSENDDDNDGEVTLMNMKTNFRGTCYVYG